MTASWHPRGLTAPAVGWLLLSALLFAAGASPAVVSTIVPLARRLQPLENIDDLKVQSVIMLVVYVIQYLVLGGVFEGTHHKGVLSTTLSPKHLAARRGQVLHEILAGIVSLAVTILLSIAWMYLGEPRTLFYGYFETHEWTPLWMAGGVLAYVISFDTYFYGSHMLLHENEFLWHTIHKFHHQYKEPSA
jgi:lathosterol oxidase